MKRLLVELDIAFSILRMPFGTPKEEHFTMLEEAALVQIEKLWNELGISHTPKVHALMRHALDQMKRVGGFGDMLEDHVEKSHQDMDKFHQRVATLRSFVRDARQKLLPSREDRSLLLGESQSVRRAASGKLVQVWR